MTHKEYIESLISLGKIEDALKEFLLGAIQFGQTELKNNLLLLSARYKSNENDHLKNIIILEDYNVEKARITNALLEWLKEYLPTGEFVKPESLYGIGDPCYFEDDLTEVPDFFISELKTQLDDEFRKILRYNQQVNDMTDKGLRAKKEKEIEICEQNIKRISNHFLKKIIEIKPKIKEQNISKFIYDIKESVHERMYDKGKNATQKDAIKKTFRNWIKISSIISIILAGCIIVYLIFHLDKTNKKTNVFSIAVLPIDTIGFSVCNKEVAMDIHQELITKLGKIKEIQATSSQSVKKYQNSDKDIETIANELGVSYILEGNLQCVDSALHITFRLIKAHPESQIWSHTYDYEYSAEKLFPMQSKIAQYVATSLGLVLTKKENYWLTSPSTFSIEAYTDYLEARKLIDLQEVEPIKKAKKLLTKAIKIDSLYTSAWISLAECWVLLQYYEEKNGNNDLIEAQNAANKALEIDPDLGEAHTILGGVLEGFHKFINAEEEYKLSLLLNPNNQLVYDWYGFFLLGQGRYKESAIISKKGLEVNPFSPVINENLSVALACQGKFEEAKKQLYKTINISPEYNYSYNDLGENWFFFKGRLDSASYWWSKAVANDPESPIYISWLSILYMHVGDLDKADSILKSSEKHSQYSLEWNGAMTLLKLMKGEQIDKYISMVENKPPSYLQEFVHTWFLLVQLRNQDLKNKKPKEALARYEQFFPELIKENPIIDHANFRSAVDMAYVLIVLGEKAKANKILTNCINYFSTIQRLGMTGYWIKDVEILAMTGHVKEAILKLRLAIKEGWRAYWWYFAELEPDLNNIRKNKEFQKLMDSVKIDMKGQKLEIEKLEKMGKLSKLPIIK